MKILFFTVVCVVSSFPQGSREDDSNKNYLGYPDGTESLTNDNSHFRDEPAHHPLRRKTRAALKRHRWPNGRVPVEIDDAFSSAEKEKIFAAMREMKNKTCIEFYFKTFEDNDYISIEKITHGHGSSRIGKQGGKQILSVKSSSSIIELLVMSLGFIHEHRRPDRDDYVEIIYDNIDPNQKYNFNKYDMDDVDLLGSPYYYGSIMHYHKDSYAKIHDGDHPTITAKNGRAHLHSDTLTDVDIQRIRKFYKCSIV